MSRLVRDQFKKFGADLAPNFSLNVSGLDAGKSASLFAAVRPLIASISFEDDENLSSELELEIINQPDTSAGQPVNWNAVVDSKVFQEGNFIDLWMGYDNDYVFMDRCEIVRWLPDFPAGEPPSLIVKAYDGRHRMQNSNKVKAAGKKKKTYYKNTPDEFIVLQIAAKYGFPVEFDKTEVIKKAVPITSKGGKKKSVTYVMPTRVQEANKSDWDFLYKLAQINDFDLWVDYIQHGSAKETVVHFKKKQTAVTPGYLFTYNGYDGSLISAQPNFTISDQATSVEIFHYDNKTKNIERIEVVGEGKAENVKLSGKNIGPQYLTAKKSITRGSRVRFSAYGQTITAISDKKIRNKKDAKSFAEKFLKERERELITLTGTVIGVPTLRSRQVHEIRGLSNRLDGFYRFTNTKHTMSPDSGSYIVEFSAYKVLSQDLKSKREGFNPRGVGKEINRYNRINHSQDPVSVGNPGIPRY